MKYLLDTCVISELISNNPHNSVINLIISIDEDKAFLSVITIGEIQKGINLLKSSKRKIELSEWLKDDLLIRFKDRIINIDKNLMISWGTLMAKLELKGKKIPIIDSFIAASCLEQNLTLITRNTSDFKGSGISLINPWEN